MAVLLPSHLSLYVFVCVFVCVRYRCPCLVVVVCVVSVAGRVLVLSAWMVTLSRCPLGVVSVWLWLWLLLRLLLVFVCWFALLVWVLVVAL